MNLTIEEFRNDPERVAALRRALEVSALREAMQILGEKGPGVVLSNISDTFAAVKLGHAAGWTEYHTTLQVMATHPRDNDIENENLREPEE